MGVAALTARRLTPASFLIDFAVQNYALFHCGILLPPTVVPGGLAVSSVEAGWSKPEERRELETIVEFVPYYSLGNLCIAAWMEAWNSSRLDISNIFVTINTFAQLFYITTKLGPMNTRSVSSVLTHIVSKTFAGIGMLNLLHNTSAAFFRNQPATLPIKVLTGVGFGLASAASDWIFGGCLVYDLVAQAVEQSGTWRNLLTMYAVGAAGIVTARNTANPPYVSKYEPLPSEDGV